MHGFGGFGGMMGYGYGLGFLGILGPIMSILFWVIIIALVIYAVRAFTPRRDLAARTAAPSALEILQQRYVRGEINKEQYDEMKKDLLA